MDPQKFAQVLLMAYEYNKVSNDPYESAMMALKYYSIEYEWCDFITDLLWPGTDGETLEEQVKRTLAKCQELTKE